MGESVSSLPYHLPLLVLLPLLPFLLLPPPTVAFDFSSLLAALGGQTQSPPCPSHCNCTTRRAQEVMQDYLSRYLPYMGGHMRPDMEKETRSLVNIATSWIGKMAEIRCHVPERERVNLTDLLQGSGLSFKALQLTCGQDSSVVWDLPAYGAFLNILDISGCNLEKANGSETLAVPLSLWVLDLNDVPAEAVRSLDLTSVQMTLLTLSITNTSLVFLPSHWSSVTLYRTVVVRLVNDDLSNFTCEIKGSGMSSLILDHNNLTAVPACVLDGSKYAQHLSLRHNSIESLKGPLLNNSENNVNPKPYVLCLDVAYNKLETFPPLREMDNFALDVSNNRLHSLAADSFVSNPLLKWLDLSNNYLELMPVGAVTQLPLLGYLNLSHNRLSSFDFDQSPLSTEIATLDLRHNRLIYPPFADTGFVAPRLSRISAAHNPFKCDCHLNVFLDFLTQLNATSKQRWFALGYWELYEHDQSISQPYVDVQEFRCSQPADMNGTHLQALSFKEACPLLDGCPSQCRCEFRKGDREHVSVDCSQSPMTDLPTDLPLLPNVPIVLYVNQTGLKRLEHRPYLQHISEMHASHSRLSSVTPGAMEALRNITVLSLDHNQLRSLPAVTHNLTMAEATNISLGNNPWTCGCNDAWMPEWLEQHAQVLFDLDTVRCRWTGEMVTKLDFSDLNCGVFNYLPLVIALSMLLAIAIIIASLLVKFKLELLVFLYTRFRVRPFDMYKYNPAQNFQFDVFVSFSQHDYHWVVEKLVDQLENRPRPYRLCIHLRDFPVGAPIADSISWAVNNSRCTLLVLTRDFLASEWCRHEFRMAHARLLKDPNAKVLIVVHGPVDARQLDRELLAYLRTNTYLKSEDKWFWAKLEYALPHPQDPVVLGGNGEMEGVNGGGPPQPIELDTILPVALAAGDVYPKA